MKEKVMTKRSSFDTYVDMSNRYHNETEDVLLKSEEHSATLTAGTYLVEYMPSGKAVSFIVSFLEWDPSYGKTGGWFTAKGTFVPFKSIWRIAKTEGKTPETERLHDWRNSLV